MREHTQGQEHTENVQTDTLGEHSPSEVDGNWITHQLDLGSGTAIIDLGMSDIEYLQALAEGRDPRKEQVYEQSLIAEGVDPADAKAVASLIDKYPRLPEEQAIVTNVWRKLIAIPNVTEDSVLPLDTDGDGCKDREELTISANPKSTDPIQPSQRQAAVTSVSLQPPISKTLQSEASPASQEATVAAAVAVAEHQSDKLPAGNVKQFVETLARTAQTTPDKLCIQMGPRLVYGQTSIAKHNRLSQEQLKALVDGLQQPVTKGFDASQYALRQPEISVKAGDEVVFRQERNGTVSVNSFQQQLQAQQQLGQQVKQEPDPIPTAQTEPSASFTSIAVERTTSQAEITQPSVQVAQQSSQQQAVSEPVQPEFSAAQVAQKQAEKLPPSQTQQFIKALTRELSKRSFEAVVAIASIPQWKRSRDVANTALELFHHNYKQTGELFYHAENYTVKLDGISDYTISDNKGQGLMRFQAGGLTGPRILENRMSRLQYQHFTQARNLLQRLGGVNGISKDPQQRLSQLGNLAPKGDREVFYATKIKQVVQTARDYLRSMGVSSLKAGQQGNYSMESRGDDYLRLESQQDQRGTVLLIENGTLLSNLESKDFSHFKQLHNSMQPKAPTAVSQQPVVKKSETEILLTNSQLRNVAAVITAQNVLDSLGTNTYESDNYRFERLGSTVTLAAKDGRGEIARMESGRVIGQLSSQDAVFLSQMNRAVMPQPEKSAEFPAVTAQTQSQIASLEKAVQNDSKLRTKALEIGD